MPVPSNYKMHYYADILDVSGTRITKTKLQWNFTSLVVVFWIFSQVFGYCFPKQYFSPIFDSVEIRFGSVPFGSVHFHFNLKYPRLLVDFKLVGSNKTTTSRFCEVFFLLQVGWLKFSHNVVGIWRLFWLQVGTGGAEAELAEIYFSRFGFGVKRICLHLKSFSVSNEEYTLIIIRYARIIWGFSIKDLKFSDAYIRSY